MSNTINDDEENYTTTTGIGENITLVGNSNNTTQTIISNGDWDNINLNGYTAYVHVNIGAAFNGNNGILTEDGESNVYFSGSYAGLYATFSNNSSANITLTGTANIHNNSQNTSINNLYSTYINGNNAGLSIDGSGASYISGTYNSINATNINTKSTINASGSGTNTIIDNGGSISFTEEKGTLNFTGNNTSNIATIYGTGNESNISLSGNNQHINLENNWENVNGIISALFSAANATIDNLNIYNTSSKNPRFIGSGNGDLTYNDTDTAYVDLEGKWNNISATFEGQGDNAQIHVQNTSYITVINNNTSNNTNISLTTTDTTKNTNTNIKNGASFNGNFQYNSINTINATNTNNKNNTINAQLGNNTTTLNIDSGTMGEITEGNGHTTLNYNIGNNTKNGEFSINLYNPNNTDIILKNTQNATLTYTNNRLNITHNGVTDTIYVNISSGYNIVAQDSNTTNIVFKT